MDKEDHLESDSDDEDYVPPTKNEAGPEAGPSAPGEVSDSDLDSAAADAFYEADAVPEHPDSDLDRPGPGAGSSSSMPFHLQYSHAARAGGSSSGAGASSSAGAAASSSGAAASSAAAAAAPFPVTNASGSSANANATDPPKNKPSAADKAVEQLWRDMNKPSVGGSGSSSQKRKSDDGASGLGAWLNTPAPQKAQNVSVPRLEEVEKKVDEEKEAEAEAEAEAQPAKKQKLGTGLEAILNAAKGGNAPNTLDKTKESWTEYKKEEKDVAEELDSYKKDKNRYTDKVAFLERSNIREWEYEQSGKKRR